MESQISALAKTIHKIAVEKGFWEGERNDAECIALMHSELSEALEGLRSDDPPSGKIGPKHSQVEEELADVIIRVLDFACAKGLDIEGAMQAKIAYNAQREYKHGRKF